MALNSNTIKIITDTVKREADDLPVYNILGLVEKESNGVFFWGTHPIFNIEGHYFYRNLSGDKLKTAISQGLAAKKAGVIKVPAKSTARIAMLNRMIAIDREAALRSISMGVGQVMGEHFKRLGYRSAVVMWQDAQSIEGQIRMMLRFIETDPNMRIAIANDDYKTGARIYNGPAYKKNNYDVDWKRYADRYRTKGIPVMAPVRQTDTQLWTGRIKDLGYTNVRAFQTEKGLEPDGIIGKLTKEAVENAESRVASEENRPVKTAGNVAVAGVAVGGIGVLADNATTMVAVVRPILDASNSLADYGSTTLLIGGAGIAIAAIAAILWMKIRK